MEEKVEERPDPQWKIDIRKEIEILRKAKDNFSEQKGGLTKVVVTLSEIDDLLAGAGTVGGGSNIEPTNFLGKGTGGECVCSECGYTVKHKAGVPCSSLKCPKCKVALAKKVENAEVDITENYIRLRQVEPDNFQKDSFRTIDISKSKGIKAVIGRLKGKTTTTVQSYLFDKSKWDATKAKAWVKEHKTENSDALEYTIDAILSEIRLSEKHLRDYLDEDKNVMLCQSCMREKHLPLIKDLSVEGTSLTDNDRLKSAFLSYSATVKDMLPLVDDINNENAKILQDKLRDIRKDIEFIFKSKYPDVGVLSEKVMYLGWVPDRGISGLSPEVESVIPEEYRFWDNDKREDRILVRNKFSEAIVTGVVDIPREAVLSNIVIPEELPDEPFIRHDDGYKPKTQSIWKVSQDADRIEFDGTLLSYGAWNGYYYPPEVIDAFNAATIVGMPVKFEHGKDIGKYTFAKTTDDHSIHVKGWIDDPQVCALVRSGDVDGLSPKVFFHADDSRKTVTDITKIVEGSVVKNPACKVCFIEGCVPKIKL